jgi:coenzyme F420-dependent glucose-6-phosphate dehydrogenase
MSFPSAIGLHCSHEQHAPSALLKHATLAAQAGFAHAMCSDHFQPWSERQGHSGFTWSWLGAAMQATPLSFGTVCAPGQRYHPAIIAQAAATLAEMYGDRFWIAVGSGEALNEFITGDPWPKKADRNARLKECVDIMRALWAGETVTADGLIKVREAKLHVDVQQPPLVVGAALSAETARWLAGWADALITVASDDTRAIVDAFREGGGDDKPMFLQVALSYAPTDDEAACAAHDQWRHCALPATQLADLRTPTEFDRATVRVSELDVVSRIYVSSDISRHVAWLHEDAALGFDRLYLHNVARDHQERFIEACAARLLPAFAPIPSVAR